ncbi:hypothetical protein [Streptomyces sp. 1331.2]|uniref:hypothetical protein n=1 Tax=Streptomyces sp. 1331.2 TaxID=1938835 RepID=UPI000BC6CF69|nr:hypothetical protein [Streptomyces sp. 1331.2]SOB82719.1 hypothetical protein SAMN06272789_2894 [Streptomyces sp. 1331.2]
MADQGVTAKTSMLKRSFAEFFELRDMVDKISLEAKHINDMNLTVGGNDEIGKQYHKQVDEGTKNLTDLLRTIHATMLSVGENGEVLAATLDNANDQAGAIAKF